MCRDLNVGRQFLESFQTLRKFPMPTLQLALLSHPEEDDFRAERKQAGMGSDSTKCKSDNVMRREPGLRPSTSILSVEYVE